MGAFDFVNFPGPNWSWAEMDMGQNDPEPDKGHMIQTFVISGTSDYCHR